MKPERYLAWQEKIETKAWYRRFLTVFGLYSVAAVFLVGIILLLAGYSKIVLLAFVAFVLSRLVLSPLIYIFYKKFRPYQKYKFETIYAGFLFSPRQTRANSFPSDHAMSFAPISFVIFWYLPVVGLVMFALTVVNGYSRIALGYHDQWDVFAGWTLGVFSALVTIWLLAPVVFTRL